jgi:hypothetical protein
MPIMPSTQSQSIFSAIRRLVSGLWGRPHPISEAKPPSSRVNPHSIDVLPVRAEPIRYTGRVEAAGQINAPAKDYSLDSEAAKLRTKISEYTGSGRKYVTWEANLWRVRVNGKHVGYYRSIKAAVRWRNAYCRKHNIPLQGGD